MTTTVQPAMDVGMAAVVLDALPDATAVVDSSGTIVAVNHTWKMFALDNGGSPESTGPGVNYLDVCDRSAAGGCADAALVSAGLRAVLSGDTVHSELEYPCPSPAAGRWFLLRINPLADPVGGAVISHVNITRRKSSEAELAHQAAHDSLTGLANRARFAAKLAAALTTRNARSAQNGVGVLYLDLDRFKAVNDTYGHDAGDEVLIVTAHRLRNEVRPQDLIARLGGDEFAIIADRITSHGLSGLAARITAALRQPRLIHGTSIVVDASVGYHLAGPGETPEEIVRGADQAMYRVKRHNHE